MGQAKQRRPWRPGLLTCVIVVMAIVGLGILMYPSVAQWASAKNQSKVLRDYQAKQKDVRPDAETQLKRAREYNDALTTGVDVLARSHVPRGTGTSSDERLVYDDMLRVDDSGVMARLRFPAAEIDIPVYHGTEEDTLLKGAGHLEGSHLPIGGVDTHSVITGHRGLAQATMFSHLDRADVGDRFTIEVFGEVLTYEVNNTRVVEPDDTDSLRASPGKDLVTLITCTPLGINSHRILVTAKRVTPTPRSDLDRAGAVPELPGFPWWALIIGGCLAGLGVFVWRSGYSDARARLRRQAARSAETVGAIPAVAAESEVDDGTGVLTRAALIAALDGTTQGVDRNGVALLFVQAHGLETMVERSGPAAGDEVLRVLAQRICEADDGQGRRVARCSANSFVAVREDTRDAEAWSEHIRTRLVGAVPLGDALVHPWCSTVLVTTDGFHNDAEALLAHAEAAAQPTLRAGIGCERLHLGITSSDQVGVEPTEPTEPTGLIEPAELGEHLDAALDDASSELSNEAAPLPVLEPSVIDADDWLELSEADFLVRLRSSPPRSG